jgi:hypothetical protein
MLLPMASRARLDAGKSFSTRKANNRRKSARAAAV